MFLCVFLEGAGRGSPPKLGFRSRIVYVLQFSAKEAFDAAIYWLAFVPPFQIPTTSDGVHSRKVKKKKRKKKRKEEEEEEGFPKIPIVH